MTPDYSIQSIGSPFGNYGLGGYNAYSPYYPSFGMGMTPGLTAGIGMMPGMTPEEIDKYLNEQADKSKVTINLNSHLEFLK